MTMSPMKPVYAFPAQVLQSRNGVGPHDIETGDDIGIENIADVGGGDELVRVEGNKISVTLEEGK